MFSLNLLKFVGLFSKISQNGLKRRLEGDFPQGHGMIGHGEMAISCRRVDLDWI